MLVLADRDDHSEDFVEGMRRAGVPIDVLRLRSDVSPSLLVSLVRYLRAGTFDLIHTHLYHADLYGTLAARLAGYRRIVSTKHGFNPWQLQRRYAFLARLAACSQRGNIVISDALGAWLAKTVSLPRARMRTIHYALDSQQFRQNGGPEPTLAHLPRPVIGTVSRLLEQKGVHVLIAAFAECLRRHQARSLVIAGDGPARGSLEAMVRDLGLAAHVHFLGHVPHERLRAVVETFDIFGFPSFGEGFGLVLLEAMACEKPVVASNVLAIPEIVRHEETGLLVPAGDATAMAQALLRLTESPDLRRRFGQAGRQRAEKEFTVERMVRETMQVYREVLQGR
jgi:glycosyltransferase involved in cell wall biosynthesis